MKKILILFVSFIIFSGGSVFAATNFMRDMLDSWVGYPVDEYFDACGFPDYSKIIAGHEYVHWSYRECSCIIKIDKKNIITGWRYYNWMTCPFSYLMYKDWVNPKNDPWKKRKEKKMLLKKQKQEEKLSRKQKKGS